MPVSLGCTFEFGFAVGPAVPASISTLPAFLDWCRANPGLANFGSPAAGRGKIAPQAQRAAGCRGGLPRPITEEDA